MESQPPFPAYEGKEPYVFISYAHKDAALVYPELVRIRELGVNVWYDEGIKPAAEWLDMIATALKGAQGVVFFVSPRSISSLNCQSEIFFAVDHKKPILSIHFEGTNIGAISRGMHLVLGNIQGIMKFQIDEDVYDRKLREGVFSREFKTGTALVRPTKLSNSYVSFLKTCFISITSMALGSIVTVLCISGLHVSFSNVSPPLIPAAFLGPIDDHRWKNSLGMEFVPAGTSGVLLCSVDTRLADFQAFVNDSHYPTSGCLSIDPDGVKDHGRSWRDPGFFQDSNYPVVGVSWNDAVAFCSWLTNKERKAGLLKPNQTYRLPTDLEWTAAAGPSTYPWGDEWPTPPDGGNYAREDEGYLKSEIPGKDGFVNTSPVGSFTANQYGLYDMGGNVWQWCQDYYRQDMNKVETLEKNPNLKDPTAIYCRVVRGGSWHDNGADRLRTDYHDYDKPTTSYTGLGFRCALVTH